MSGRAGRMAAAGAGRMGAWRVHAYGAGARELRLEEARVPPLRAPDDVLVRVAAASVNPLDVAMIGGYGARALNALRALEGAGGGVEFPLVAGRDFAGRVERAGPAARLRPGQRVWGVVPPHRQGAHADYVIVKDRWAGPAPATLDDAAAGGAPYAALTACALLRAAGLPAWLPASSSPAPRVLLLGLGGVGQAALQLLVNRGAHVTVGCSGELAELAASLGAAEVLDRHAEGYHARLEEGGPYAAALDCAGLGAGAGGARLRCARYATLTTPLLRELDARGLAAGALAAAAALAEQSARARPAALRWAYFAPRAADLEAMRRLAERGRLAVRVERLYPRAEAPRAYERAARGGARGKIVIDFTAPTTT